MRVRTAVVEMATLAVVAPGQELALRRTVALQLRGAQHAWHVRAPWEERADKLLRRGRVAAARPQHVEDVVVLIDRAPPGMPLAMHG